MSIHNPSRLLNKRKKLCLRKQKKLCKIITSEPHIKYTINGAILNGNLNLAISLMNNKIKVNY